MDRTFVGQEIPFDDKYVYWEHQHNIIPKGSFRCAIIGKSSCGKSRNLLSLLKNMTERLKYVMICSTIEGHNVHEAIEKWCEETGKFYYCTGDLDDALENAHNMCEYKTKDEEGVLVFDDWTSGSRSHDDDRDKFMVRAFSFYRNYRISCVCLAQYSYQLPPKVLTNCNLLMCFKTTNRTSKQGIVDNIGGIFDGEKFGFDDLYNAFIRPFQFNYLAINTDTEKVICVMFNGRGQVLEFDARSMMKALMRSEKNKEPTFEDEREIHNDSPLLRLGEIISEICRKGMNDRLYQEAMVIVKKYNVSLDQVNTLISAARRKR